MTRDTLKQMRGREAREGLPYKDNSGAEGEGSAECLLPYPLLVSLS